MAKPKRTSRPDFPPFTFPNLCLPAGTALLPFASYPERSGWSITYDWPADIGWPRDQSHLSHPWKLASGDLPTHAQLVSFLQAWLFFSAAAELSDIFQLDIDVNREFAVHGDGWMSTDPLNTLRQRCLAAKAQMSASRAEDSDRRFSSLLFRLCRENLKLSPTPVHHTADGGRFGVSEPEGRVYAAFDTLLRAIVLLKSPASSEYKSSLAGAALLFESSTKALLRQRWCPSEVSMLTTQVDREVVFFASTLQRPLMFTEHGLCDEHRCLADQVAEERYETVHVQRGCRCGFVELRGEILAGVLEKGRIPRVLLKDDGDDVALEVVQDGAYLAISHVWAHGLGNPHSNALPRCQIHRLKSYLDEMKTSYSLTRRPALWIDTLCIPVSPSLLQSRKQAIKLLAPTYQSATFLLVLDRELCAVSPRVSLLELAVRILCSGWLRRLWTLQEASLVAAEKIHIQMAELQPLRWYEVLGSVAMKSPEGPRNESSVLLYWTAARQIYVRIPPVIALQRARNMYSTISDAVKYRTTSKQEDEPVCMASLLGLPLREILDSKDSETRMARFYQLMMHVPAELAFSKTPKLRRRPFRWAPSSLINDNFGFYRLDMQGKNLGVCDEKGFHVHFHGAVLAGNGADTALDRPCIVTDAATGQDYVLNTKREFPPFMLPSASPSVAIPRNAALIFQTPVDGRARDVQVLVAAVEDVVVKEDVAEREEAAEYVVEIVDQGFLSSWSEWAWLYGIRNEDYGAGKRAMGLTLSASELGRKAWCVT